eukprot:scaffold150380_cov28-Tisochrysis_lutea.AAC.8
MRQLGGCSALDEVGMSTLNREDDKRVRRGPKIEIGHLLSVAHPHAQDRQVACRHLEREQPHTEYAQDEVGGAHFSERCLAVVAIFTNGPSRVRKDATTRCARIGIGVKSAGEGAPAGVEGGALPLAGESSPQRNVVTGVRSAEMARGELVAGVATASAAAGAPRGVVDTLDRGETPHRPAVAAAELGPLPAVAACSPADASWPIMERRSHTRSCASPYSLGGTGIRPLSTSSQTYECGGGCHGQWWRRGSRRGERWVEGGALPALPARLRNTHL